MEFVDRKYCCGCINKYRNWCMFWSEPLKETRKIHRTKNCKKSRKKEIRKKIRYALHPYLKLSPFDLYYEMKLCAEYEDRKMDKDIKKILKMKGLNFKRLAEEKPEWFQFTKGKFLLAQSVLDEIGD